MYYRECPVCGAHLDPCESCDCTGKREDAPDAAGTPSQKDLTAPSVTDPDQIVNRCLHLREIRQQTGAMAKDAALVVRDVFPKFNRQLLAQCEAWDKYGVIIHPAGLNAICKAYGVSPPSDPPPIVQQSVPAPEGMTQCERIIRHLKDFGSITSLEAMKDYGIMRLASRISDLKKAGYHIASETENGKNRYGEKTSYSRYRFEEDSDGTDP